VDLWLSVCTCFFPVLRNVMMQVHPYTYRNENKFLHFDFHQDPYQEYSYWIHNVSIDGLFTDFVGTLHLYQEWTSPLTFP
jgi:glycerophosphoryl diester phosphodiesterase